MSDQPAAGEPQAPLSPRLEVVLIVALSTNAVIGCRNQLPWRLPDDLRHFKALTIGHPVIMGRKTYESIGKPLPKRQNLVLSQTPSFAPPGVTVVRSPAEALAVCAGQGTIFVIGGAQIYALFLPLATRLELTRVHVELEGDAYFPHVDWQAWHLQHTADHAIDEHHAYRFTWESYTRG